jgi:hypothetical protein
LRSSRRLARVVVFPSPAGDDMSQRSVERVIGRLVTDEGFRRRFAQEPESALREMAGYGQELTECERHALAAIDVESAARFAEDLDPRLQKTDIQGGIH